MNASNRQQNLQRYGCLIQYHGKNYHGWQKQPNIPSIQQTVEKAIAKIANHPVETIVAGRTDKGVHAIGQVIHFDTTSIRSEKQWLAGINNQLGQDILLKNIKPVAMDFHARFSATSRTYHYHIYQQDFPCPFKNEQQLWVKKNLNIEHMKKAAAHLIGEHDFSSFRSSHCQANNAIRTITSLNIDHSKVSDQIKITITANAFLHNMVRNIIGILLPIGENKKPIHWAKEVLLAKNRSYAGKTIEPHGLYLANVTYPKNPFL